MKKDNKKLSKKWKLLISFLVVFLAIGSLVGIFLGVKYSRNQDPAINGSYTNTTENKLKGIDTLELQIDWDGDRKSDRAFTFTGKYTDANWKLSFSNFLKYDIPKNFGLSFQIIKESMGDWLNAVTVDGHTYSYNTNYFWEIDRPGGPHGTGENGMTDVGMSDLNLEHNNVFILSYQKIY